MTLTTWFRRHKRHLVIALAVLLMVGWGIVPAIRMLRRTDPGRAAEIRGKKVTQAEIVNAEATLRTVLMLGMVNPRLALALQYSGAGPRTMFMYQVLATEFSDLVFEGEPALSQDALWRLLILLREARAARVQAGPDEVVALLSGLPRLREQGEFSRRRYQAFLRTFPYTDAQVSRWLSNVVKVVKLLSLKASGAVTTRGERWMLYAHRNKRARVRYVKLDGPLFAPLVEPTDAELKEFYERYQDRLPDPDTGQYGYMAPERVKLEYAIADVEVMAEQMEVSEEEVRAYYDENREEFAREPEEDTPEEADGGYKSLQEVWSKVEKEVARRKAREEARERVEAVIDDLTGSDVNYGDSPRPLGQMARRHGLRYEQVRTPAGRTLLWRREIPLLVPAGERVAEFAFGPEQNINYPAAFTPSGGPFLVVQVLEKRRPERRPFSRVRGQVREDLVEQKALETARTFAAELKERAQKIGLEAAAEEAQQRLRSMREEAGAEGAVELTPQETEPFPRSARRVPGLAGAVPGVVEKAFELQPGDVGVAEQGPPVAAAFVIETLEHSPADPKGFEETTAYLRARQLNLKQRQLLQGWMQELLAQAKLPEQAGE